MPLPLTGPLSMSQVTSELGIISGVPPSISLNSNAVRRCAASVSGPSVLTGTISMNNLRGGSATDVFVGGTGASQQLNAQGFTVTGYSSAFTGVDGFSIAPLGSWATVPIISFLGNSSLVRLYTYNTFSGSTLYFTISSFQSWAGPLVLYPSTIVNDTWPATTSIPLSFTSTGFGNPGEWRAFSSTGFGFNFSQLRSFRIAKA